MADTKALTGVAIKDADKGLVSAVFATLNVIDKDGDVTEPGAFHDGQQVRISAYGHASWGKELPVGRGVVRATDTEALLAGQFFLDTIAGRETFATVKAMGDLQEWSYGFDIVDAAPGEFEGQPVRFLRQLLVHEVSPVLLGAGIDTRTLAVKSAGKAAIPAHSVETTDAEWDAAAMVAACPATAAALRALNAWVDPDDEPDAKGSYKFPHHMVASNGEVGPANTRACSAGIAVLNGGRGGADIPDADREGVWRHLARHLRDADVEPPELRARGLSFSDEAEHALAAASALVSRSGSLADLRAKEGRVLSAANRGRLASVAEGLRASADALDELLAATDPDKHAGAVLREFARYERLRAAI